MSLLDDLRSAAKAIDPSFQPTSNEVTGILAAFVHYTELGDEFLKAAEGGAEDVSKLLAPEPPAEEPAPAAAPATPADSSSSSVGDLEKQISDLQAQLAARQATAQQTTVEHETGSGETEPAAGA